MKNTREVYKAYEEATGKEFNLNWTKQDEKDFEDWIICNCDHSPDFIEGEGMSGDYRDLVLMQAGL